ncbi:hypothetical protein BCR44DRAFT_1025488 [Catenaria anguillulae PL171]|uniref:Uncharacterized protein n=1 Tax=Catenaria anguillulae PL171 TaxID=765915 RepID=A0A1Y2HUY8_9FUNG|nr:hypothetical protein BCR44DRAFT_1025488 [Catenaria anguillulae PL171]
MRGCQSTSTSSTTAYLCGTMIAPQGSAVGPSPSGKSALERARRDRSLRKLHQQRSAMRAMTQAQIARCLAVEPEADPELCDNVKTQRLVMEQKKCEQEERKMQEAARKMQIELQVRIAKEQEEARRQQREARQRMILERVEQYCAVREKHVLMRAFLAWRHLASRTHLAVARVTTRHVWFEKRNWLRTWCRKAIKLRNDR